MYGHQPVSHTVATRWAGMSAAVATSLLTSEASPKRGGECMIRTRTIVVEDVAGGRAAPCRAMATLGMSEAVRSPARGSLSRSGARRWLTSVGAMTGGAMLLAHAIAAHQRRGMIGSRASRGGTGGTHGGVLDLVPQRGGTSGTSGTSLFARPAGTRSQP